MSLRSSDAAAAPPSPSPLTVSVEHILNEKAAA
jgi:hypothetical protein